MNGARSMLTHVARGLRVLVAGAAALLLVWSFYWVGTRSLRGKKLTAGQVQITVVHWGDKNEDRIVARLVEDFERQPENADIRVLRINPGPADKVNTKLRTMFAAGEPPDVFYLDFARVADFADADILADIEAFIRRDREAGVPTIPLEEDFFESVVRAFRYDRATRRIGTGTLIALPKDFTTVGFYYNKDLFRRAGLKEPSLDGWTWDEFLAAARTIGKLENCYGADFVTWEAMVRLWLWTHDLDFFAPGYEELHFTDPEVLACLEKLQRWFHGEPRTLLSAKTQLETGQEPFLAGNVGLAGPFGRWKVPTYRLITGFDWDFAPLPQAAGKPKRNGVFTVGWALPKEGRHAEQAWRFVKYLMSPRGQELMCAEGLAVPALRSVAAGPVFSDPTQKPVNYRYYLDAAEYADPIDFPANQAYSHTLRVQLENVYKIGKPVAPAMRAVEREWNHIREKERVHPPMAWGTALAMSFGPLAAGGLVAVALWWQRRPRGYAMAEERAGALLTSPWLIGFLLFCLFPIVLSLLLAFTRWSGMAKLDAAQYMGWGNFRDYFDDAAFRKALWLTVWYALLAVPSSQVAALIAALLMNREWKSIGVFRAIWYLPSVLAGVGMAVMWKWVFHHEHGLVKALLDPLLPTGWTSPAWFEKDAEAWGVPAFAIINLWAIGGTMMIYLAGLKGVSKELYEAAEIDGASSWRRFVHVTLPMLSPVILFNVIIAVIASFQVFTQAYVMTGGGPGDATRFYVVYLYNNAFDFHAMGYASGMAWLLLLIVLGLTIGLMMTSRRFVHYEGLKT